MNLNNGFLNPFTCVYVAQIPKEFVMEKVFLKERNDEILSCQNEKVKKEKYFVWKLLEFAFKERFLVDIKNVSFKKSASGKWTCDLCFFSLSHSQNAVAVALSNEPVGVDLQAVLKPKNYNVAKKFLNDDELFQLNSLEGDEKTEYFIKKWTQKESVFKSLDLPSFFGAKPNEFNNDVWYKKIFIANQLYYLSVTTENKNVDYCFVKEILN